MNEQAKRDRAYAESANREAVKHVSGVSKDYLPELDADVTCYISDESLPMTVGDEMATICEITNADPGAVGYSAICRAVSPDSTNSAGDFVELRKRIEPYYEDAACRRAAEKVLDYQIAKASD